MKSRFFNTNRTAVATLMVALAAAIMLLPFAGLTEFNSKGEPREAVVALSMINDGNWILPENNGGDIPYKPPFFHFCIAVASLIGGSVNEFTSRLPSVLALIAMVAGCFAFFMKRKNVVVAALSALLMLTSFEVHRAGMNCRVDMMLTAFVVGALLAMYSWHECGARGLPWWGIVCMSGAVLTKGPVGFVLPCLVMGCFMLLRGGRFWTTFFKLAASGLLACVVPLLWYVAAYQQGGQRFLDLVIEENFGRMTGTMSYESHAHPFTYNFVTLATGWLPWTLLALFALFVAPWKKCYRKLDISKSRYNDISRSRSFVLSLYRNLEKLYRRIAAADPLQTFVWLSFIVVLVFYCLPASKRSVYLLPCYPFMAYLLAELMVWLSQGKRVRVMRTYGFVMAAIALLLTAAFVVVKMGMVPETLFKGKHAAENIAMLVALRDLPLTLPRLFLLFLSVAAAVCAIYFGISKRLRADGRKIVLASCMVVFTLFMALDGVYQPAVMNTKSLRPMAETIRQTFPHEKLYSYISTPMMHFFGANFYLDNKIDVFEKEALENGKKTLLTPDSGVLIVAEGDSKQLVERHADYRFSLVKTLTGRPSELKDNICLYRFSRLSTK